MNPALKNLIRHHYLDLEGYVSAGMESIKSADKIFMNANENPYPLTPEPLYSRYPEPQPAKLAAAYASAYNVEPTQIAMTRGADEAIAILTRIFCEPHKDAVIISSPTFGIYGVDALANAARLIDVPLIHKNKTFILDKASIIKAAYNQTTHVKMIYICSPNNPTGGSFSHADILEIARETNGQSVVILDETYAEFTQDGSIIDTTPDVLESTPNLIILRTLSKSYALAGCRMGCFITGDPKFIEFTRTKVLETYPLPHASVNAALYVLSDKIRPIAHANIQKIILERQRMASALKSAPNITHIYDSDANFLLVGMQNASAFIKHASTQNIILRDFSNKPATANCIRITIGTPEQNDKVLELLERF